LSIVPPVVSTRMGSLGVVMRALYHAAPDSQGG
jgi:hypothetical protein